ncbi:hypothetical protein PF006_g29071 [Phytophthora fragariae]|uniref:Uncharacterized protein n=1 Tax=Phytophthora fragariae TaxID=53985 RepID=A0A6A3Q9J1_9STRA|nr:hypothetical protein PF006_g29071 [Phytophthora fragariae]
MSGTLRFCSRHQHSCAPGAVKLGKRNKLPSSDNFRGPPATSDTLVTTGMNPVCTVPGAAERVAVTSTRGRPCRGTADEPSVDGASDVEDLGDDAAGTNEAWEAAPLGAGGLSSSLSEPNMTRSSESGDKSSRFLGEATGRCERGGVVGEDPPASDARDESPDPPEDPSECSSSPKSGDGGLPPSPPLGGEPPAGDPG